MVYFQLIHEFSNKKYEHLLTTVVKKEHKTFSNSRQMSKHTVSVYKSYHLINKNYWERTRCDNKQFIQIAHLIKYRNLVKWFAFVIL